MFSQRFGGGIFCGEFGRQSRRKLVTDTCGVGAGFAQFFHLGRQSVAFGGQRGQLGVGVFSGCSKLGQTRLSC